MREEHRRGMRDEGWGPPPRPGRPEWGPRTGTRPGQARRRARRARRARRPGGRGGRGERGEPRRPRRAGSAPVRPWAAAAVRAGVVLEGQAMFGRHAFGRGPRVRKGDVRAAILDLLAEGGQWNGYQLIQEISGRTSGVWRPSAGSVYPALQQLEDEGLIAPEGEGRRRMYSLTEAGRAVRGGACRRAARSWDAVAGMTDEDAIEFDDLIRQVMMAVMEVRRAGSPEQLAQARDVLAQTRRSMYRILAEDDPTGTAATARGRRDGDRHLDGHRRTDGHRHARVRGVSEPVVQVTDLVKRYGETRGRPRHQLRGTSRVRPSASSARTARASPPRSRSCAPWRTPPRGPRRVAGYDVRRRTRRRCEGTSAWSSRTPTLDSYLTGEQNLRFHADLYGVPRAAAARPDAAGPRHGEPVGPARFRGQLPTPAA